MFACDLRAGAARMPECRPAVCTPAVVRSQGTVQTEREWELTLEDGLRSDTLTSMSS